MSNQFTSILARIGLDLTGLKEGFAKALNLGDEFRLKFSKLLKAGGLRGPAKFLGVGSVVYGMREAYQLATERAKELTEQQEKQIENAYKLAEAMRGTPQAGIYWERAIDFSAKLDEDTKAMLRMQQQAKGLKDGLGELALNGVAALISKGEQVGRLFRYLADTAPTWLGGRGLTGQQAGSAQLADRLHDIQQPRIDLQQQASEAARQAEKTAGQKTARDRDRLEQDKADAAARGLGIGQQVTVAQNQQKLVRAKLAEHTHAMAQAAARQPELDALNNQIEGVRNQKDELQAGFEMVTGNQPAGPTGEQAAAYKARQAELDAQIADLAKQRAGIESQIASSSQIIVEAKREGMAVDEKLTEYLRRDFDLGQKITDLKKEQTTQTEELAHSQTRLTEAQGKELPIAEQLAQLKDDIADAEARRAALPKEDLANMAKANDELAQLYDKQSTLLDKQAQQKERLANAEDRHRALTAKEQSLLKEKATIDQQVKAAEASYNAARQTHAADEIDKLEHYNSLLTTQQGLNRQIKDNDDAKADKLRELNTLRERHEAQALEKLSTSEKQITSGERGNDTQRALLQEAARDEQRARELYDDAQSRKLRYTDPQTGKFDPRRAEVAGADQVQRDVQQYQKDLRDAQALAGKAEALHAASGSQEGIQGALTENTFKTETQKVLTELARLERYFQTVSTL